MPDSRGPDSPVQGQQVTVVVLTGGRSSRMGQDKATMRISERSMLDRILQALPTGIRCVIAGPHDIDRADVVVIREERAFGGPAAGLAAAVPLVTTPYAVVCAVDMPLALPHLLPLVGRLAASEADAVIPVDAAGHRQMLAAAYRTEPLQRALEQLGDPYGRPLREVLGRLSVVEVGGLDDRALLDVDTPEDAESLTALIEGDDSLA